MGFADIERTRALLERAGLDGLLIGSSENFAYFSGVSAMPGGMWRRLGPVVAIVSAVGELTFIVPDTQEGAVRRANPAARVLAHPVWIESVEVDPEQPGSAAELIARATAGRENVRPETYDQALVDRLIREALGDAGLLGKRLGIEFEAAPYADVERLREQLGNTRFADASPLIRELRLFKTPREIELLRLGTQLTELGISRSLEGIGPGTTAPEIAGRFSEAIYAEVRERRIGGFEWTRTTVHLGARLWGTGDPNRTAQPGDLIQFDSGVQIQGYQADIGRTFCYGSLPERQREIQAALLAGFRAGLAELRPGRRFSDVYQATLDAVRAAGFPSYARGHFGHSLGSEIYGEEWPWISPGQRRVLEPGMVLAFEVPYYINGIGGFQTENNLLITEDGHETFNALPPEIVSVGR